jgi:hypothetical protein
MKILGLFSQASPVPLAMAIQAHQPDIVVMCDKNLGDSSYKLNSSDIIESWLHGSNHFLQHYFKDLSEPFQFPYTPPNGYIGARPIVERISGGLDELINRILELKGEHPSGNCFIDLLPGSKFFKIQLMLRAHQYDIDLCYTTESGEILQMSEGTKVHEGKCLPLVDRCWLSGHPVFVTTHWNDISDDAHHYQSILDALWPSRVEKKNFNSPMVFDGTITTKNLQISGFDVKMDGTSICIEKDEFSWKFDTKSDDMGNGLPYELLLLTQLGLYWPSNDLIQGVNIIHKSADERYNQLVSKIRFLSHQFNDLSKSKSFNEHQSRWEIFCNMVGASLETDPDELARLYVEYMKNQGKLTTDSLSDISVCEIDCLRLSSSGVQSFDSKVILSEVNFVNSKSQRFTQQPDALRPTPYYVISSSNPPANYKNANVLHITRLKDGPDVLIDTERYLWRPHSDVTQMVFQQIIETEQSTTSINNKLDAIVEQLELNFALPIEEVLKAVQLNQKDIIMTILPQFNELIKSELTDEQENNFDEICEFILDILTSKGKSKQSVKNGSFRKNKNKNKNHQKNSKSNATIRYKKNRRKNN